MKGNRVLTNSLWLIYIGNRMVKTSARIYERCIKIKLLNWFPYYNNCIHSMVCDIRHGVAMDPFLVEACNEISRVFFIVEKYCPYMQQH